MDNGQQCQRCSALLEDRHHVFFTCTASADLWERIGLTAAASYSDTEIWSYNVRAGLDANMLPFVLMTVLWRFWDARNGEIFRNERSSSRSVISRVCDDFVIWRKRLKGNLVTSLNGWRNYLLSCNDTAHSSYVE